MSACPNCGRANAEEAKFCSECGTALAGPRPTRQERKVVTVLFADLVGFTARAEQLDPEDVHALLAPYHARVKSELERFGGTVEKFIGDAVVALFGATAAHEDDPERGVRAALAIRDWVKGEPHLQVRIGITTGEVLVSLDARPEAGEGMASGDVVNTASRLQTAAPVGGILVDQTTYRATDRVIGYAEAEPVDAKGKSEPIPVWQPVEALSRLGVDVRHHGGAELVGRHRELEVLTEALARVRERREPELVTLVGVPGIGKSRLVHELLQEVDREPALITWRRGRSLPYGDGVTFWALGEMVKAQAGILDTDGADDAEAKVHHATRAILSEPSEAQHIARYLRPLVGLGTQGEVGQDASQAFAAWRRFFEALAAERPLVLIFEDLHWADHNLLDFVDHLAEWASGAPILIVGTARPELLARRAAWGGGKANSTTLSLRALSDVATATLVRSLLDRAVVPADVQTEVLARAGGNPLYAEEFARMVAQRIGNAATPEERLPDSIHGIIAARLDALPPSEKTLLQAASVVGKVFWRGTLAQITGANPGDLDEPLHALERKEFIGREPRSSVAGENEFAFRHVLTRDVAYSQIPRPGRADMHRQAAEWIESLGADRAEDRAEMLAHHFGSALEFATAAGQPTGEIVERTVIALRDAGERARALNAPTAAAGFYARALELLPSDHRDRPELLFGRAQALHVAGDDERITALEQARDALLEAGSQERAAQAELILAQAWWIRAGTDEALAHQRRAEELLAGERGSATAVRVLAYSARLKVLAGKNEEALRIAREILPRADELGLDHLRSQLATTIGMARVWLGDEGGFADMERGRELARAAGDLIEAARATQNLASVTYEAGQIGRGWALSREALELAKQAGAMREVRFQEEALACSGYDLGGWNESMEELDRLIADSERSPSVGESEMRNVRAMIRLARGQADGALEDVRRAIELSRQQNEPQMVLPALAAAARLHAELGMVGQAGEFAAELMAHPAARPLNSYRNFAWVAVELGYEDALRQKVGPARAASRWAAAMLAVIDGTFAEAADRFSAMDLRPDEADARFRAARELVAAGRGAEAETHLRRAIDFYRAEGASRYLEQAEALLPTTVWRGTERLPRA